MLVSQDSIAQFHVCFQQPCSDEETAVQVFWSVIFFSLHSSLGMMVSREYRTVSEICWCACLGAY